MPGYSPASNTVSTLTSAQTLFYDRTFIKNLKVNLFYLRCMTRRTLPANSGNQLVLFRYNTLGPNTAQAAEGTVGTGLQLQVVNNTCTIGQYADYLNFSDLVMQTAIDPALENGQKELAYRLALSLSTLGQRAADSLIAIDPSVNVQNAFNQVFTKANINAARASMAGRNIKPMADAMYMGIVHPFVTGDATNDTTYGSATDILKRTAEGTGKLQELPSGEEGDTVPVLEWAGVKFMESTLVTTTPNYKGNAGVTAFRTYIFGEDALISVSLGETEQKNTEATDDWRNLQVWTNKYDSSSVSDPSRMIGGSAAYNTKWTVTPPPDPVGRARLIDASTNIS